MDYLDKIALNEGGISNLFISKVRANRVSGEDNSCLERNKGELGMLIPNIGLISAEVLLERL